MTPQQKQDLQAAILSYERIVRDRIETIIGNSFDCTPDKIISEARRIITTCSDIIEYNSRAEELRKILETYKKMTTSYYCCAGLMDYDSKWKAHHCNNCGEVIYEDDEP